MKYLIWLIIILQIWVFFRLNSVNSYEERIKRLETSDVLFHALSDDGWKGFESLTNQVIQKNAK